MYFYKNDLTLLIQEQVTPLTSQLFHLLTPRAILATMSAMNLTKLKQLRVRIITLSIFRVAYSMVGCSTASDLQICSYLKIQARLLTVLKFPKNLPIPFCPEGIDRESWAKAFQEATVYLIGTAHFSKESQEDVVKTITATQPDLVMVELCPSRISILSMDEQTLLKEASDLNTQKILTTIKQSGVVQGILHVLLLSMSAHITRELSMAPGGEFRAAHKAVLQTQVG
ncbi:hypothetical protein NECAME_17081 [Necator americanus]|uniref:TraB family protein n=1 Tax=Necator americanus TaxID=51031 RepID=W2TRC8_NECAM|nr:hypothetical protein NECAME_17081 [Necator americanus]ETN84605.1 hypothetical protein NECAME_17081 [Necator americanus]